MPITQIPFQDPVAPPEKPQPEQLGLYDARGWETAYRDLDAHVPHLLIQLQDDLSRSRRREAAWISIIAHLVLIILVVNFQRFEKYIPFWHSAVVLPSQNSNNKDVTFLALPPDLQKLQRKPNTNVMSDKDRTAMTRHPELDLKELRKSLATPPPGRPGLNGPPAAQQQSAQPSPGIAQNQPAPQSQPQQAPNPQISQLQTPAKPNVSNDFRKYASPMSAGSVINEATRAAAATRGAGQQGSGGDFGLGTGAHGRQLGALEILSDTQGVDFGPYLQRILQEVKDHWYRLIPESAEMKKGKLTLEFAIMKDGSVRGLTVAQPSGDVTLDRPAYGSITGSDPFPPLPTDFKGQYLALRFRFFYNPDKADLE